MEALHNQEADDKRARLASILNDQANEREIAAGHLEALQQQFDTERDQAIETIQALQQTVAQHEDENEERSRQLREMINASTPPVIELIPPEVIQLNFDNDGSGSGASSRSSSGRDSNTFKTNMPGNSESKRFTTPGNSQTSRGSSRRSKKTPVTSIAVAPPPELTSAQTYAQEILRRESETFGIPFHATLSPAQHVIVDEWDPRYMGSTTGFTL